MLQIMGRLRMTSIEISDLVGSRHDSVKRAIERLATPKDDGTPAVIQLPPMVEVKIEELGLLPFENEARPAARLPNLLVRAMTKSNNQLSVWQPRKKTNRL